MTELNKTGLIYTSKANGMCKNPLLTIIKDTQTCMNQILSNYGIGPKNRKLATGNAAVSDDDDELTNFFKTNS